MMRTLGAGRCADPAPGRGAVGASRTLSGAKIAVAVAVIGAVFGEWSGSDEGLGHLILVAQGQLLTARVFAAVVVLSAIAIGLFGAARAARAARRLVERTEHVSGGRA